MIIYYTLLYSTLYYTNYSILYTIYDILYTIYYTILYCSVTGGSRVTVALSIRPQKVGGLPWIACPRWAEMCDECVLQHCITIYTLSLSLSFSPMHTRFIPRRSDHVYVAGILAHAHMQCSTNIVL